MSVPRKHGKVPWNQVDLPALNRESLSTGCTYPLFRDEGCPWMRDVPSISGAWLSYNGPETHDRRR